MYSVTGLEELPGSLKGFANPGGINNPGQVVGWADFRRPPKRGVFQEAFLWSEGVIQALGFLPHGEVSEALAINDSRQVVGWSGGLDVPMRPFMWSESTGMQDLGTLDDREFCKAHAINNSAEVVGWTWAIGGTRQRAFMWSESTGMQDLGTLPDSEYSVAHAINDSGQVVGWSRGHPFMWSESTGMQDLGTLADQPGGEAYGLNNSAEVVGRAALRLTDGSGRTKDHAFMWSESTGMQDLGTLPDSHVPFPDVESSKARSINDSGEVVGVADARTEGSGSTTHAFIWSERTGMQDLNDLLPPNSGWELLGAHDINGSGQILCDGLHTDPEDFHGGRRRLCVLTPS